MCGAAPALACQAPLCFTVRLNTVRPWCSTLALRLDTSGDPTFETVLQRAKDSALEAFAHGFTPFSKIVDSLKLVRSAAFTPIYQASSLDCTKSCSMHLVVRAEASAQFDRPSCWKLLYVPLRQWPMACTLSQVMLVVNTDDVAEAATGEELDVNLGNVINFPGSSVLTDLVVSLHLR